jgi:hypothetical protein
LEEFPVKSVVNRDNEKVAVDLVDDSKIEYLRNAIVRLTVVSIKEGDRVAI